MSWRDERRKQVKERDKMDRKGFTLVEVMIVVSVIALLTAIAIPNVLKMRLTANDVAAQATLKTISTAFESFLTANGVYPPSKDELLTVDPPYLSRDYFVGTYSGFTYGPTFDAAGYAVAAVPVTIGKTGTTTYTITTGGVLENN